jgi:hypothetical protein
MKKYAGKIMRWTLVSLVILTLAIVTIMPAHKTRAALTKTTALDGIDAWQSLAVATVAVGNSEDISLSYSTVVYVEVAYTHANAQAGVELVIEASPLTGDDWTVVWTGTTTGATPNLDDLNEGGGASAGDTTITLTDTTGNYDNNFSLFFVVDTTVAESEVLRVKSEAANVVTLCQDLKYNHVDAEVTTDEVYQKAVSIPFPASYVRVLVNNSDADATIHWRSHCSKVTALN